MYDCLNYEIAKYKLFNHIIIKIKIIPDENATYRILKLETEIEESNNDDLNSNIEKICAEINLKLEKPKYSWRIFYLLKELLQKINEIDDAQEFNYFRGQSQNWPMLPGICRPDTSQELKLNFERLYKKIANQYPKELEYVEYNRNDRIRRSKQLSILQHYGLRTSLTDITSNPFIALLFMVSEDATLKNPVLDCFQIDEDQHYEHNIFIEVQRDDNNKRISAQKGAFFNYDYLKDLNHDNISLISRLTFEVELDMNLYIEYMKDQILSLQLAKSEEDDDITSLIDESINNIEQLQSEIDTGEQNDIIYTQIKKEIRKKLEEFYYKEEDLYLDLDKQIEYMQNKYQNRKTRKMSEI